MDVSVRPSKIRMSAEHAGLLGLLGERAQAALSSATVERTKEAAAWCFVDWLGVTIAGAHEPVAKAVAGLVADSAAEPVSTVIGSSRGSSPELAALANGTAGHALDYDDFHPALIGHPTAAIAPAVFALGESRQEHIGKVLEALVVGTEVACAVGEVFNPGHYQRGWHSTATIGVLGAAAGCAYLIDGFGPQWGESIAVAAAQSSGLKSAFGSMVKPYQVGTAAMNGLFSAHAVSRGVGSTPHLVEGPQGFADVLGGTEDVAQRIELARAATSAHEPAILSVAMKFSASCYLTHGAIECVTALRSRLVLDPDLIEQVVVTVNEECDRVCNIGEPQSGLEAKFSLRQCVAMALAGLDTSAPASFSDESARRPDLIKLRRLVQVRFADGPLTATRMEISLKGQSHVEAHEVDLADERIADPAHRDRVDAKFRRVVGDCLGQAEAGGLLAGILASCSGDGAVADMFTGVSHGA